MGAVKVNTLLACRSSREISRELQELSVDESTNIQFGKQPRSPRGWMFLIIKKEATEALSEEFPGRPLQSLLIIFFFFFSVVKQITGD